MFFSKIFRRCYSAIDTGTNASGIGAAFVLGRVSQLKLKNTAQCSFGSYSVHSGEPQKSLTRPDVEVKFSNTTNLKFSLKGRDQ